MDYLQSERRDRMIADLHCDTISKLRDYHLGRLVSEDDKNGTSGVDEGKKQNRDDERVKKRVKCLTMRGTECFGMDFISIWNG